MSKAIRLRRVLKVFCLGCLLPLLVLGTGVLIWAVRATRTAAERLEARRPIPAAAAGEGGGFVNIPGLPAVPRESAAAAIPALEVLTQAARTLQGENSAAVGRSLGFLAQLYGAIGDLDRAQTYYEQARRILEAQVAGRPDLGWLYNNMGMIRLQWGEIDAAAEIFARALEALPAPSRAAERAIVWQNLASAATHLGDWEQADAAYLEAIALLEGLGPSRTRELVITQHNWAALRLTMGDHERARAIDEKLLAGSPAPDAKVRLALFNDLGEALRGLERFQEAEARLLQAVDLTHPKSEERATVLGNLALVALEAGDVGRAKQHLGEALAILEAQAGTAPAKLVASLSNLAMMALAENDLAEADQLLLRAENLWAAHGSQQHPLSAALMKGRAVIAQQRGDSDQARKLAEAAMVLDRKHLGQILSFGSEAQRLSYRKQTFPYDLLANLGEPRPLADAVLTMKGAVSASLFYERALARRSTQAGDRERLDRIRALKRELMAKLGEGTGKKVDVPGFELLERRLEAEETALAKSLSMPVVERVFDVDLERVQAALEPRQVLIEMVRFEQLDANRRLVPHYGALLISANRSPRWILLGAAAEIEEQIARLGDCLAIRGRGSEASGPCEDTEAFLATLRRLHRRFWQPLATALPEGTQAVILSPDAALHFVPWAALPGEDDRFVAEDFTILYITSGRQLLQPAVSAAEKTLLAVGRNDARLALPESEARFVASVAKQQGWQARVLTGDQAREEVVARQPSARVLHFATHGSFLRLPSTAAPASARSPLLRGYLHLAQQKPESAEALAPDHDGFLNADEIAGLDLTRTWLCVLSACETGLGEAPNGEGVLGLRHGFRLAGAQHLLFSLWRIHDADAYAFMERFYPRLFATSDPRRAFAEVQREELIRLRRTRSLVDAVLGAGAFVLSR